MHRKRAGKLADHPQYRRWRKLRLRVLESEPYCRLCRATGRRHAAVEVDHIVPRWRGGATFDLSNCQPLCRPCHQAKTAKEGAGPPAADEDGVPRWRRNFPKGAPWA